MAAWKRRTSRPVAAPAESKGNASDIRPSAEEFTKCVAIKLETETDPERRRNIEACLEYVVEKGYPFIDEVFIALDSVVEHVTEKDFFAIDRDWLSLTASGQVRKDVAFVMAGPDYELNE